MLTHDDLAKIEKMTRAVVREEVQKIVREEVENEVKSAKNEIQADINMSRIRVQSDIEELKDRIKNLEIRTTKMHKELKEEIKMVSHFLDKENMNTLKRVKRIEDQLHLAS